MNDYLNQKAEGVAELRKQIDVLEREGANLSAALLEAEDVRKALLVTGSNGEISAHDAGMDRTRLDIKRTAARADLLRSKLPAAAALEEQRRQDLVATEIEHLAGEYRSLVEQRYPEVAAPLVALASELQRRSQEIHQLNEAVPHARRIVPDAFRRDPISPYWFAPLWEAMLLPGVMQFDATLWPQPEPAKPVPVRRTERVLAVPEFAKDPVINDARIAPGREIKVERVDLAVWMAEREARLAAERAAKGGSAA